MRFLVVLFLTFYINAEGLYYCPIESTINEIVIQQTISSKFNLYKHKGYEYSIAYDKNTILKMKPLEIGNKSKGSYYAFYSTESHKLKYAGVLKNNKAVGRWCYVDRSNQIKYKNFDIEYSFNIKKVYNFIKSLGFKLKSDKFVGTKYIDIYKPLDIIENVWLIRFLNFELYIDADNGKVITVNYYYALTGQYKEIDKSELYRYNQCILESINKKRSYKQINKICNVLLQDIQPGWRDNLYYEMTKNIVREYFKNKKEEKGVSRHLNNQKNKGLTSN